MSPFGATTTSDGELKVSGPSPAMPGLPSVISTRPSGAKWVTVCSLPSVTHRVPSGAANRPCGQLNSPDPKLTTSRPVASNFWMGAMFDRWQVLPPQRSSTRTPVPSRSMSTPIAIPQRRPSGSFAQLLTT